MKALELASFSGLAERISALYNEEQDALLLAMLGQEYIIRHDGITLHGQKAPDSHAAVIIDYLFSTGNSLTVLPWRTLGDFAGTPFPEFRQKVELPVTQYAAEVITRANAILPLFDAKAVPSLIGSDMAMTVRALPKVYLRVEMSQETQDFPAEVWVLFSNNAHEFLSVSSLQLLAEIFKDRVLSLLRIY
ncbi:MAG: hypothetical protein A2010_07975 [Nitrospirae bacterium GWD2_57_9]|nr:MAG: hypothetical protein A2010_07975 [Nitrospirae bacterium GWD2_57_9]OGW46859.1 MAG: hypothetical protein A2078_09260 [Nitrospirae bacterium GWC2_57_9]